MSSAARPLDPALVELVKALARANVDRDIERLRRQRDSDGTGRHTG